MLSRQFREISRSRIEGLLASFPKLADSGTQHTTVEQDNVRYVYQPLDELYMVLITNRQSNILQDIDSLHLFAQVVSSICKSLDEREILRNAYEILSAFDEVVTLGYRENLSLSQIKTFLEMESHEERIQEIISRVRAHVLTLPNLPPTDHKQNKEMEATEDRKRKAKQLELQRKEMSRTGRGNIPRVPSYPTYTPPPRTTNVSSYDSYEAEKNKSLKTAAPKGKGMQLGSKKSKTTDIFDKLGVSDTDSAPLVSNSQPITQAPTSPTAPRASTSSDRSEAIHITIAESISASLTREGTLKSLTVKGDLQVRILDPSFSKIALALTANPTHNAAFKAHPNVDKTAFANKSIQLKDATKGFPTNISVGVLRWTASPPASSPNLAPISFTVWVNKGADSTYALTVEYESSGEDTLRDVVVTIPYATAEPAVSSFDAQYEVSGDTLEWTIGTVDEGNATGSFEFEAEAEDESEFFPMSVRFAKSRPFVDVDVSALVCYSTSLFLVFSVSLASVNVRGHGKANGVWERRSRA